MAELTVLSFGGGQDSTAILYAYIYDPAFRLVYGIKKLLVVIAETGNEHEETYAHSRRIELLCKKHSIEFVHINFSMGFHKGSWSHGLVKFYEKTTTVGSKAFRKTCTDNLKIKPIYRFLEYYVIREYALAPIIVGRLGEKTLGKLKSFENETEAEGFSLKLSQISNKKGLVTFAQQHGKIQVLIGIAKGEETRISKDDTASPVWFQNSITKVYPLVEMGLDREGCQQLIKKYGHSVPPPSNCIICPFMSLQELLWLYRFEPAWYNKWVVLEAAKINRFIHLKDKNLGVWGKKLLPEMLVEAQKRHGHMTDEALKEYKMSHGHCVKSKY